MFNPKEKRHLIVRCILYFFADPLAKLFIHSLPRPSNRRKKILLVRLDHLGDFVLWLDAAKGMRRLYPEDEYSITLLANDIWADLARPYPFWDEIMTMNVNKFTWNWKYRWDFLRDLAHRSFDITIHPLFMRLFWVSDAVVRGVKSAQKIGWSLYKDSPSLYLFHAQRILTRSWYTQYISIDDEWASQLQMNAHFIRMLGLKDFKSSLPRMVSPSDPLPINVSGEYAVIASDASWEGREWDLEKFCAVAHQLFDATHWQMVFVGTNIEVSKKLDRLNTSFPVINLMGKTTIEVFTRIIAGAKMVIGNDSAAIHLGSALGVRSFCIAGGGHWGRFIPYVCDQSDGQKPVIINQWMACYNCYWICCHPRADGQAVKCIDSITADKAWSVIKSYLGEYQ